MDIVLRVIRIPSSVRSELSPLAEPGSLDDIYLSRSLSIGVYERGRLSMMVDWPEVL